MPEDFDILKSAQDIVTSAGSLGGVADCDDPNCPLMMNDPSSYLKFLEFHVSINPDFCIGLAYPDRHPLVRFVRFVCPEAIGKITVTFSKTFLVVAKEQSEPGLLGPVIGSNTSTPFLNKTADDLGIMVHPVPKWALDYLALLRSKFTVGELITAKAALDSLRESLATK